MKIGVVRYPGSNCFYDTMRYFNDHDCFEIWHKNESLNRGYLLCVSLIFFDQFNILSIKNRIHLAYNFLQLES